MKAKRLTRIPGMGLTAMLTLLVVQVLVFGQDASADRKTIVGAWQNQATLVDCTTGAPILFNNCKQILDDVRIFNKEGTLTQIQALDFYRSPSHGIWERGCDSHEPKGQSFSTRHINFRFTPDGQPAGRAEVKECIVLSHDGDSYTATGTVEAFDLQGNAIPDEPLRCTTEIGERFTFPSPLIFSPLPFTPCP